MLLTIVLFALVNHALSTPLVSTIANFSISATSLAGIVEADKARVDYFLGNASFNPILATNQGNYYTVEISVGTPPVAYEVIVDTGSANTWVGARHPCPTDGVYPTTYPEQVTVYYGSAFFSGTENLTRVAFADGLHITNQSIGCALESTGISDVDGILGLGPQGMTQYTEYPSYGDTIPTVTDNLFAQGQISEDIVTIILEPSYLNTTNGDLVFGSVNTGKNIGPVIWTNLTDIYPASRYWGINSALRYGKTEILQMTAGVVDTGTTLIQIASDAFEQYVNLTGAVLDPITGFLTISPEKVCKLQSLYFIVEGELLEVNANAQVLPFTQAPSEGGNVETIYLTIADIGSPSGSGMDFIMSYVALQRWQSSYDTTNGRVGLSRTLYTDALIPLLPECPLL